MHSSLLASNAVDSIAEFLSPVVSKLDLKFSYFFWCLAVSCRVWRCGQGSFIDTKGSHILTRKSIFSCMGY